VQVELLLGAIVTVVVPVNLLVAEAVQMRAVLARPEVLYKEATAETVLEVVGAIMVVVADHILDQVPVVVVRDGLSVLELPTDQLLRVLEFQQLIQT
jgi:hypothetical protein